MSSSEKTSRGKRVAQLIVRELLDEGIIPNGNLKQAEDYIPLLAPLIEDVKGVAKEAARKKFRDQDDPRLRELATSEIAPEEKPLVGTLLSDVVETEIQWLWRDRLALGKISTLDGDPGLGKSTITLDIAARVSTGREMPDGTDGVNGGVVLISPEDSLSDTVVPRLSRAGANLRKIVSIGTVQVTDANTNFSYERPFSLPEDLQVLEDAIKRVQAKLIIIDPIMAILGNKDIYKDNEVRSLLAPVKSLVEQAGAAVIMVRHFTKGGGDHAIYRGGGSMAFIGLARTGFMVAKDPDNEAKCVFANIKNNLRKEAQSLSYVVASDEMEGDERPYIAWQGVDFHTTRQLMSSVKPGEGRQKILQALKDAYPEPMTPKALEEICGLEHGNVQMTLKRMMTDEQVMSHARGLYTVPGEK